jgi:hypothetical protein
MSLINRHDSGSFDACFQQISPIRHVGSLQHRRLKPIMLVPCKQPSSGSKTLNGTSSGATGLGHFQPSSEQRQFDADIDFDTAPQPDALARGMSPVSGFYESTVNSLVLFFTHQKNLSNV